MKIAKKIVSIFLIILIAASFAACSGGNGSGQDVPEENVGQWEQNSKKKLKFKSEFLKTGKKATEKVFSKYKVNVVIVWGSWCGSCRAEMPQNESMYRTLKGEKIGMIGIVTDGLTSKDDAIEVSDENETTYRNIIVNESMAESKYFYPAALPYKFIVDDKGKVIDDGLTGAYLQDEIIEKAKAKLEEINNKNKKTDNDSNT